LHELVKRGNINSVREFLKRKGVNVNARGEHGWTPLLLATGRGGKPARIVIAKMLLDKGADIDKAGDCGWTPLHMATQWCRPNVVKLLLKRGANVNKADTKGRTPLHWACHYGWVEIVKLLLAAPGIKVDKKTTERGFTPLMVAARNGNEGNIHIEIVKLLLKAGADPFKKSRGGKTALWLAQHDRGVDRHPTRGFPKGETPKNLNKTTKRLTKATVKILRKAMEKSV